MDRVTGSRTNRLGRSPTVRQVGQALELPDEAVLEAMEAMRAGSATSLSVSRGAVHDGEHTLEASIGVDEDGFELAGTAPATSNSSRSAAPSASGRSSGCGSVRT